MQTAQGVLHGVNFHRRRARSERSGQEKKITKPPMNSQARRISFQRIPEVKQDDHARSQEGEQEAHIPEEQRGRQEAAVEDDPGPRIEALDQRFAFAVAPGDQHIKISTRSAGIWTAADPAIGAYRLPSRLALDSRVGSHQQRHQDRRKDQVRSGGGQELTHNGRRRAEKPLIQISEMAAKPMPRKLPSMLQVTAAATSIFSPKTKRTSKHQHKADHERESRQTGEICASPKILLSTSKNSMLAWLRFSR